MAISLRKGHKQLDKLVMYQSETRAELFRSHGYYKSWICIFPVNPIVFIAKAIEDKINKLGFGVNYLNDAIKMAHVKLLILNFESSHAHKHAGLKLWAVTQRIA